MEKKLFIAVMEFRSVFEVVYVFTSTNYVFCFAFTNYMFYCYKKEVKDIECSMFNMKLQRTTYYYASSQNKSQAH